MSLTLVAALAVSGAVLPQCSWDRPGTNAFQGDVVAAVDRYVDIPSSTRAALKRRIEQREYDEIATITRDSIRGAHTYTNLRDMHFGQGTVCQTVTRQRWGGNTVERGLVYCEDGHCLIVPTVCRNVSRVTRVEKAAAAPAAAPATAAAASSGGGGGGGPAAVASTAAAPQASPQAVAQAAPQELAMDPPAAGTALPLGVSAPFAATAAAPTETPIALAPTSGNNSFRELISPILGSPGLPSASLSPFGAAPAVAGVPGVLGGLPVPNVVPPVPGVIAVPEPAGYALAVAGLLGLVWARRRKTTQR